ncbi:YHS domain-containing (seleno)protein [Ideonella sp. A 288]|uniref:YHS domain-containing (seleno)protein n=1 Tax=Ideonella sp. A 288 TaxID=1962181 RepID=UPI000B4B778F|nr:YHS domain-containing (seleno)protein [Ideonella sp. A 288]
MRVRALLFSLMLVFLAGCGAMTAQNPSSALRPVNAVADGGDERVMLAGHDVVAYWTLNRHALGLPQFKSVYEGVTFRFASAEHKALFDQAPTRYLPQYGGYCANGLVYGIPWGGDADTWRIDNGRLFIFGGAGSKAAFELDVKGNTELADRYWKDEVAGSNSFVQRARRLVFRVPHYKSGAELAAAVQAAKRP